MTKDKIDWSNIVTMSWPIEQTNMPLLRCGECGRELEGEHIEELTDEGVKTYDVWTCPACDYEKTLNLLYEDYDPSSRMH